MVPLWPWGPQGEPGWLLTYSATSSPWALNKPQALPLLSSHLPCFLKKSYECVISSNPSFTQTLWTFRAYRVIGPKDQREKSFKHRLEKEDGATKTCILPENRPKQPANHAFHGDSKSIGCTVYNPEPNRMFQRNSMESGGGGGSTTSKHIRDSLEAGGQDDCGSQEFFSLLNENTT